MYEKLIQLRSLLWYKVIKPALIAIFMLSTASISTTEQNLQVTLMIFSKDRPMQCHCLLASSRQHLRGLDKIIVLYYASDTRMQQAYCSLEQEFPHAVFLEQSHRRPRKDFARKLHYGLTELCQTPWVMFAVDDMVVIDSVDLTLCTRALQSTGAYGFYLRLGQDITYCYAANCPAPQPSLQPIDSTHLFSWRIYQGSTDWTWPHTLDMTIYQRSIIINVLACCAEHATSPNTFEATWIQTRSPGWYAQALCFDRSKVINIPVNVVQQDTEQPSRSSNSYTTQQLLEMFEAGLRIDYQKLWLLPHCSPHVEVNLPFYKPYSLSA